MKKEYTKPKLDSKAFAQFENVFTNCDPNAWWCGYGGSATSEEDQSRSSRSTSNPSC